MNSIYLVLFALIFFIIGYKIYSKYIEKNIFEIDDDEVAPSHKYDDGIDFVPTPKHILFGHHFTSIAGARPHQLLHPDGGVVPGEQH